jgi:uncharacterized protein with HEPN domain
VRDDPVRIADMLEALERIRSFVSGGQAVFFADPKTHLAVAYEILKLGEAANGVSTGLRRSHPSVPWKRVVALRNEIVHEYFRLDLEALWEFIQEELPRLERSLRGIVAR